MSDTLTKNFQTAGVAYFPDDVARFFLAQAKTLTTPAAPPGKEAFGHAASQQPPFTPEGSKAAILAALRDYDPALAASAKKIFDDGFDDAVKNGAQKIDWDDVAKPGSWRLQTVSPGQGIGMMRCRPAGDTEIKRDPNDPGAYWTPGNPHPYAVIDYEFDGTPGNTMYLAHELGHALADESQGDAGHNNKNNPEHMRELQAYLVQAIVADHQGKGSAMQAEFAAEMRGSVDALRKPGGKPEATSRPINMLVAAGLVEKMKTMDEAKRAETIKNVMGGNGPMAIGDILQKAGLTDTREFAQATLIQATGAPKTAAHERDNGAEIKSALNPHT